MGGKYLDGLANCRHDFEEGLASESRYDQADQSAGQRRKGQGYLESHLSLNIPMSELRFQERAGSAGENW